MPDIRAVRALSHAWWSQREQLTDLLRARGYDPDKLEELPDPEQCECSLAAAIRRWREINDQLDAAHARTSGWRY